MGLGRHRHEEVPVLLGEQVDEDLVPQRGPLLERTSERSRRVGIAPDRVTVPLGVAFARVRPGAVR